MRSLLDEHRHGAHALLRQGWCLHALLPTLYRDHLQPRRGPHRALSAVSPAHRGGGCVVAQLLARPLESTSQSAQWRRSDARWARLLVVLSNFQK